MLPYKLVCALSSTLLGLLFVELFRSPDAHPHFALITLIPANAIISWITLFIRYNIKNIMSLPMISIEPPPDLMRIFPPFGFSLLLLLVLRLAFTQHFNGEPIELDFGLKYGEVEGGENIAFTNEFTTYAHFVQGILCGFLLFPALTFLIATKGVRRNICESNSLEMFRYFEVGTAAMVLYPLYNIIKRLYKHGIVFASTSAMNNGMEWALGYLTGFNLGMLLTIGSQKLVSVKADNNDNVSTITNSYEEMSAVTIPSGESTDEVDRKKVWPLFSILRILLPLTVFTYAYKMGSTWNQCLKGVNDCYNYAEKTDFLTMYGFILVPSLVYFGAILLNPKKINL